MAAPEQITLNNLSGDWVMGVSWFLRKAISLSTVTLHIHQYSSRDPPPSSSSSSTSPNPSQSSPSQPIHSSSSDPTTTTTTTTSDAPADAPIPSSDFKNEYDPTQIHIDINQTATGGIKGTTELRVLNWKIYENEDYIFGKYQGRSRWVDPNEIDDEFLKRGWLTGPGNGGGGVIGDGDGNGTGASDGGAGKKEDKQGEDKKKGGEGTDKEGDEGKDEKAEKSGEGAEGQAKKDEDDGDDDEKDVGGSRLIQAWVKSTEKDWEVNMLWGFEDVGGERRHARHVVATDSKGKRIECRLVYDYKGPRT